MSSQYGTTSFGVSIIDETDGSSWNGDAMLSGSGSFALIMSNEYIHISDFLREDSSPGSVDLVSLSFSVDMNVTVVCYFINSADENLYPDGVSIYCCIYNYIITHITII